jgi:hypothetical protein
MSVQTTDSELEAGSIMSADIRFEATGSFSAEPALLDRCDSMPATAHPLAEEYRQRRRRNRRMRTHSMMDLRKLR